ncbi:MAG TPA: helix-hairpin-helix domain-containing protein [Gallionellaceae bacterium]
MSNLLNKRVLATMLATALLAAGCHEADPDHDPNSPAYQSICHGLPLGTVEARMKAVEDGYAVDQVHDCITKIGYEQKVKWDAEHTPEAMARAEAERLRKRAEAIEAERLAAAERAQALPPPAPPDRIEIHPVEINSASEAELATVISITPDVAAQIVAERKKGRFLDWTDVVRRVVALSAAQNVVYASSCGLTVNGLSFPGAPPDPVWAAAIRNRNPQFQRH